MGSSPPHAHWCVSRKPRRCLSHARGVHPCCAASAWQLTAEAFPDAPLARTRMLVQACKHDHASMPHDRCAPPLLGSPACALVLARACVRVRVHVLVCVCLLVPVLVCVCVCSQRWQGWGIQQEKCFACPRCPVRPAFLLPHPCAPSVPSIPSPSTPEPKPETITCHLPQSASGMSEPSTLNPNLPDSGSAVPRRD